MAGDTVFLISDGRHQFTSNMRSRALAALGCHCTGGGTGFAILPARGFTYRPVAIAALKLHAPVRASNNVAEVGRMIEGDGPGIAEMVSQRREFRMSAIEAGDL